MTNDINAQMTTAKRRFEIIKPYLKRVFNAEQIVNIEVGSDAPGTPLEAFDRHAGIDAYSLRGGQMYGIALRICNGDYKTFTVRKNRITTGSKTEYEKKIQAQAGALLPYYTVQAYFSGDQVNSIGICYTDDLMRYISLFEHDKQRVKVQKSHDDVGEVEFYVIDWRLYAKWYGERGFKVLVNKKKE